MCVLHVFLKWLTANSMAFYTYAVMTTIALIIIHSIRWLFFGERSKNRLNRKADPRKGLESARASGGDQLIWTTKLSGGMCITTKNLVPWRDHLLIGQSEREGSRENRINHWVYVDSLFLYTTARLISAFYCVYSSNIKRDLQLFGDHWKCHHNSIRLKSQTET